MKRTTSLFLLLFLALQIGAQTRWYRGNTHTHTKNSDGDSLPVDVARWYATHGYDFVVITDHEHVTDVAPLNAEFGNGGKFLVIPGQEITDRYDTKPYHVNALGLTQVVLPKKATGAVANMQANIDAVRAAGAIPQINHPNFGWALTSNDLFQIKNATIFEIYSGHPRVNLLGGGDSQSVEEIWDTVLTAGRVYYGVAVDDVHHFKRTAGEPLTAAPGQGWIYVRTSELSPAAILAAIDRGDFYASSGVEFSDYTVDGKSITIAIKPVRDVKYRTQFIGAGGKVLSESIVNPAVYKFRGNEKYVRAKVFESNGAMAWTQPVFRKK
ncbi:MAG TPA: CehA/McbA family metallohydrolase [Pyrinomonadaceae bacterium]|nr:CehA/McbA family metallohydrolase [Pyrinomonadaceae bacterium]